MIKKTPTDPSTMLTAMCDLEKISKDAGQSDSMLTCDQQLYRVMLDVIFFFFSIRLIIQYIEDKLKQNKKTFTKTRLNIHMSQVLTTNAAQTKIYWICIHNSQDKLNKDYVRSK